MKRGVALNIIKGLPEVPQAHGNSGAVWYKLLVPHFRQMGLRAEGSAILNLVQATRVAQYWLPQ